MHYRITVFAFSLMMGVTFAFDPIGPAPNWTIAEIGTWLSRVHLPQASLAAATLPEVLDFLSANRPPDYTPNIEADETLLESARTFSLDQKNVTVLEVLSKVAETFDADILITDGGIKLRARPPQKKPIAK